MLEIKPRPNTSADPSKVRGLTAADRPTTAPTPNQISRADCQRQSVTPVRGPRNLELGSGKVAGKVLIVDHMG